MHGHEALPNLGERADGCGATADVGTRAPRSIDGASQQQLRALFVNLFGGSAGFFGQGEGAVASRQADDGLGERILGAVAHAGGVRASTQKHSEGGDNHGFTRTGFTGQNGEPRFEGEPRIGNDAEVSNMNFLNHERSFLFF